MLVALGQLMATGSSEPPWSTTADRLAALIRDYGPSSTTAPAQRAAYPFTRLRSDAIWTLHHDVPMDRVQPLATSEVVGRLTPALENALRDPEIAIAAARQLVDAQFPPTIAPDVLMAVGIDPDTILTTTDQVTCPDSAGVPVPPPSSPPGTGSAPSAASTAS